MAYHSLAQMQGDFLAKMSNIIPQLDIEWFVETYFKSETFKTHSSFPYDPPRNWTQLTDRFLEELNESYTIKPFKSYNQDFLEWLGEVIVYAIADYGEIVTDKCQLKSLKEWRELYRKAHNLTIPYVTQAVWRFLCQN
jgi:hypothetical protein